MHLTLLASLLALGVSACGDDTAHRCSGAEAFAAARTKAVAPEREWRSYLNDGQHSPLAQVDRANVRELRVAWEYAAGGVTPDASAQIQ